MPLVLTSSCSHFGADLAALTKLAALRQLRTQQLASWLPLLPADHDLTMPPQC